MDKLSSILSRKNLKQLVSFAGNTWDNKSPQRVLALTGGTPQQRYRILAAINDIVDQTTTSIFVLKPDGEPFPITDKGEIFYIVGLNKFQRIDFDYFKINTAAPLTEISIEPLHQFKTGWYWLFSNEVVPVLVTDFDENIAYYIRITDTASKVKTIQGKTDIKNLIEIIPPATKITNHKSINILT